MQPVLRVDSRLSSQRPAGETFTFGGTGFSPGSTPTRHVVLPGGAEVSFVPVLEADPVGTLRASFTTDCSTLPGEYEMWYVDEGVRSNSVRLRVTANPDCYQPLADLSVEKPVAQPAVVPPGGALDITFTIRNVGAATAAPTRARLRLGRSPLRSTLADHALGDADVAGLESGEAVFVKVTLPIPAAVEAGTYYVWVIADNSGAVPQVTAVNDFARSEGVSVGGS